MALLISGLLFVFLMTSIVVYANRQFLRPGRLREQVTSAGTPSAAGASRTSSTTGRVPGRPSTVSRRFRALDIRTLNRSR